MSRQSLIALAGSVVVVLLAFWGVTLLFPGKTDPIVGTWRVNHSPQCDGNATTFTVAKDHIEAQQGSQPPKRLFTVLAFEADGDMHRLRIQIGKDAPTDYALFASYQIVGDTLTFGKVDWTPEARAKYPDNIHAIEFATKMSTDDSIGLIFFRANQPYHRCPG